MKWNKGAPPAVGWWPASAFGLDGMWRWWDGELWSELAGELDSAEEAADHAGRKSYSIHIQWRDWPKSMRHLPGYPLRSVK